MKRHLSFFVFILLIQLLPLTQVSSRAAPTPAASPSVQLDMSFLLLPAHELEVASQAPLAPSASPAPQQSGAPGYRVGDEITLRVPQVTLPPGSTGPLGITLPPGTPSLNDEGFEIFPKPDASKSDSNELKLVVVPLKAGNLTLPSLAIQDGAGKSIARTNPWRVEVQSAIRQDDPKPQEPADLRPPAELAFPWWAVVSMVICGLLVLGALIYWFYRWSKSNRPLPPKPVEPPKPEDEVALTALAQLEKSGFLERGEYKKHYFGVSEILKTYIGERYGFDAPENTTREMMENLKLAWARELGGDEKRLNTLGELFEQLDLVKFTDHVPEKIESQTVVSVAREFVRGTRRKPVIAAPPVVTPSTNGGRQ